MMIVTGISDFCAICWEDIEPSESVYVHDKALHPLHSSCSDKWKKTCKEADKDFTCPSCNKVIEAAGTIMRGVTRGGEVIYFEGTFREGPFIGSGTREVGSFEGTFQEGRPFIGSGTFSISGYLI